MLSFKKRKTLYVFFVTSIIFLLVSSQVMVHYKLHKLESDGELINDAGRMRMLSQRIVQQSFRVNNNNLPQSMLCETVDLFQNHIIKVKYGLDPELYEIEREHFDKTTKIAQEIVSAGKIICISKKTNSKALVKLEKIESSYINAQNKFVELIQKNYENKLTALTRIEVILAIVTILIILLEVYLIFIPMDKANAHKRHELKKLLRVQKQMSRTVAHDLRSPIGSIASIHHILKDKVKFDNIKAKELFDTIGLAAENAIATASSMLVIDQGDSIKHNEKKKIKLSALAKAQVSIISSNHAFKNRLIIQQLSQNTDIHVSIHEISRMIQNIIDNALKYSKEGVLVEVTDVEGFALLSVKDSGIGMSNDLINWITGKTEDNNHQHSDNGFGLGMEFIKRTVEKHNGFISVDKLKKGTRFTVGIPLVS